MGTSIKNRAGTAEAPAEDRTVVYLGNRNAIESVEDPNDVEAAGQEERSVNRMRTPLPGKRCTTVILAPGTKIMDAAYEITHATRGVWQAHSDADAPAWVASTDPALAQLLAAHWGCELREPEPETDQPTTEPAADAADSKEG
jgi:hypothetical protein